MPIYLLSTEENAPEPTKITFYERACDCVLQLMLIHPNTAVIQYRVTLRCLMRKGFVLSSRQMLVPDK